MLTRIWQANDLAALPADREYPSRVRGDKPAWIFGFNLSPYLVEIQNESAEVQTISQPFEPFVHKLFARTEKLILHAVVTGAGGSIPATAYAFYIAVSEFEPRTLAGGGSGGSVIFGANGQIISAANPLQVNLANQLFGEDATNNVLRVAPKDTVFKVGSFPAVQVAPSASQAAGGAGVRNVVNEVSFSVDAVAVQAALVFTLRDGATLLGTILKQWFVALAAGATYEKTYSGLWIPGTANTAMTLECTNVAGTALQNPAATNFANCSLSGTTEI